MDFEKSARRDWRLWALLLVGLVFFSGGITIDPATNCDDAGNCAPWLVPVAGWIGAATAASTAAVLWRNPSRGCRLDPVTGELEWWQYRLGAAHGGRVHPTAIGRVRIISGSDDTRIEFYDTLDRRLPHFDGEVVPSPFERWAEALRAKWPHIRIDKSA